jgi:hypothetical protein
MEFINSSDRECNVCHRVAAYFIHYLVMYLLLFPSSLLVITSYFCYQQQSEINKTINHRKRLIEMIFIKRRIVLLFFTVFASNISSNPYAAKVRMMIQI